MATRRRSLLLACAASLVGGALFVYDDVFEQLDLQHSPAHRIAETIEFLLLGPGMGLLAFAISEYMRMKDEALRRELEAARQERFLVLGRVAASVAHEIRNPLHNIGLLLDEMHASGGFGEHVPLCLRVQANLERIGRAVDLVYQLTKPVGLEAAPAEGIDLTDLIHEAVLTEARRRPGTVIQRDLPAGPLLAACVPGSVRIVLDNLLRNGAAASPAGGMAISVRRDGSQWQILVSNPGTLPKGFADDGSPIMSSKIEGLGLGLFISRQILQQAGGSLRLTQVGERVEAVVTLPAVRAT
jgi:signal transduction histidine kinase